METGYDVCGNCCWPLEAHVGALKMRCPIGDTLFKRREEIKLSEITTSNPLDAKIKARKELIAAIDDQIISVFNYCPDGRSTRGPIG